MEIREKIRELRTTHDRKKYIQYFADNPNEIEELVQIILNLEVYPYKEYASWALTHLYKSHELNLEHYYIPFVDLIFKTDNQTVLRNIVNCLSHMRITDYRESELIDLLIGFVQNPKNKVALHVYSIYVLIQFVQKYPELKSEILEIIELNVEGKTPAYRIARRNFLEKTKGL